MEEMKKCMDGNINEKMGGKTETGLSSIHNYYRQWNDQSSEPNVNTHIAWNWRELPARESETANKNVREWRKSFAWHSAHFAYDDLLVVG